MIKYTKEMKPYKSNFKKILLGLFKHKTILIKYKYYIILSLLLAVISFVLGHTVAYNKDLNWVYNNRSKTEKFIQHSAESYDLQRRISLNYSQAFDQIIECFKLDLKTCDPETAGNKLDALARERDQMIIELNELNFKTETLLQEMGFKR